MNGIWPEGCHLCKEVEESGAGRSMRQDFPADESYYDKETGAVDFKSIKHIELRFSNSCNMACLHCSDVYSSGWVSKLKNYVPDQEDIDLKLIQLTKVMHRKFPEEELAIDVSISEMEQIVDDLNKNFPNIKKIDFAGGEVLYQKQFFPCLKKLAEHPNAKNINLTFHSNFNAKFKPAELSKCLEPFGKSLIHISVDAGRNIYSYFRTGNWDILVNNIKKFREVNNFTALGIVCTTSAYQIMDIENVFESFLTLDVDWIDSSIVYTPRYINPSIMMFNFSDSVLKDIKNTYKIIDREEEKRMNALKEHQHLRSWRKGKQIFDDLRSARIALKNIEDYIVNNTESTYDQYEAFLAYIRKTDKLWKQNFNDYMTKYKYIDGRLQRKDL
jgi:MoaA/NifB/PqqE/SkfB family radical SAM enzyme